MSNVSKSLVGKVIKFHFQAFLVLEELDESYVGFWATGTYKSEPEEIPKIQIAEPNVLANSMDEFVTKQVNDETARAMESKYVGTVCLGENSMLGIVTEIKDGMCVGITFDGADWKAQRPVVVARHLVDYLVIKVRERVEKI